MSAQWSICNVTLNSLVVALREKERERERLLVLVVLCHFLLPIKHGTRLLIDFVCHGFVIVFFILILDKDQSSFSSSLLYIFFWNLDSDLKSTMASYLSPSLNPSSMPKIILISNPFQRAEFSFGYKLLPDMSAGQIFSLMFGFLVDFGRSRYMYPYLNPPHPLSFFLQYKQVNKLKECEERKGC